MNTTKTEFFIIFSNMAISIEKEVRKMTIFFPGALYFDKRDQGGATPLAIVGVIPSTIWIGVQ